MPREMTETAWRELNTRTNQLYRAVTAGESIPYPTDTEGTMTFETAARYRLATLAARLMLDLFDHASATTDEQHLDTFLKSLAADGRIPRELAPTFAEVLDSVGPALIHLMDVARATRGEESGAVVIARAHGAPRSSRG